MGYVKNVNGLDYKTVELLQRYAAKLDEGMADIVHKTSDCAKMIDGHSKDNLTTNLSEVYNQVATTSEACVNAAKDIAMETAQELRNLAENVNSETVSQQADAIKAAYDKIELPKYTEPQLSTAIDAKPLSSEEIDDINASLQVLTTSLHEVITSTRPVIAEIQEDREMVADAIVESYNSHSKKLIGLMEFLNGGRKIIAEMRTNAGYVRKSMTDKSETVSSASTQSLKGALEGSKKDLAQAVNSMV